MDFTLYRGEWGEPHAVAFRCAHRGTQLSTGWVEGDHLRCFYHGWIYNGAGGCVEQPAEPEPFCQRIHIPSYPLQEYLGTIWAYLGEGAPPESIRYPRFEEEGVLDADMMMGQGESVDREQERLGQCDTGIVFQRHLYEREMRALAEGRPIKRWTIPAGMRASTRLIDGGLATIGSR
jgi:nitrite reductase/ring-hydroxylating ferredoxin subunit